MGMNRFLPCTIPRYSKSSLHPICNFNCSWRRRSNKILKTKQIEHDGSLMVETKWQWTNIQTYPNQIPNHNQQKITKIMFKFFHTLKIPQRIIKETLPKLSETIGIWINNVYRIKLPTQNQAPTLTESWPPKIHGGALGLFPSISQCFPKCSIQGKKLGSTWANREERPNIAKQTMPNQSLKLSNIQKTSKNNHKHSQSFLPSKERELRNSIETKLTTCTESISQPKTTCHPLQNHNPQKIAKAGQTYRDIQDSHGSPNWGLSE